MDVKNIILSGDSAGGYLAVAVCLIAALRGFRKPDAALVIYPVFCMDFNFYTPSLLLSLDEEILS
jgi:hormone-sensitive lipase